MGTYSTTNTMIPVQVYMRDNKGPNNVSMLQAIVRVLVHSPWCPHAMSTFVTIIKEYNHGFTCLSVITQKTFDTDLSEIFSKILVLNIPCISCLSHRPLHGHHKICVTIQIPHDRDALFSSKVAISSICAQFIVSFDKIIMNDNPLVVTNVAMPLCEISGYAQSCWGENH